MKLVLQIAAGIIIAVVVVVTIVAMGHVSQQEKDAEQQQAEFCKKLKAQGVGADDLTKAGCKQ